MNETRFAARKTQRDFHWAWYLAPLGPIAIGVLSLTLAMAADERPVPTLAANATPVVPETVAGSALAAKLVQGRPAPGASAGAETTERPSKF